MLATTSDLPPEVWCRIGQYIPSSDWPNFALVNRTFYGIIISDLYRRVEVVSRNPTPFIHAFQTLDRERDLAKRLRSLTIWVHALNEVIHLDDITQPLSPASRRQEPEDRLLWPKHSFRHIIGRRRSESAQPLAHPAPPFVDKNKLFMETLVKLENLENLVLVWQPDDGYNKTSPTTCSQLVSHIWTKIGNRIQSLTLDMAMFNFYEALRIPPELKALQELHIRVTLEKHGAFRGNAIRIFTSTLIPFINKLAPKLTAFSFTSLCNLNLDPLFQEMEPTPFLRRLSLCLAFQVSDMWSANALQTFLRNHNTIQQLSLRYADCCGALFRHNWIFHDRVLVGEAFTGANAFIFPRLDTVVLGLRFKLSDSLLLGHYVSRFSASVSSLTLLDRSLPFTQVKVVLAPFQRTLKSLAMFVEVLTPELLCLIAKLLPLLRDLTLRVQRFSSSRLPYGKKNDDAATKEQFLEEMRAGLRQDDARVLKQWRLREINVREFAYGKGDVPVWEVMKVITDAVPSIEAWGV